MSWKTKLVKILRHLINDLDASPTYSSSRLEETILVAAQLVNKEVTFSHTYTIDVDAGTLTPDPTTETKDDAFINLVSLKAACIIDQSTYRTKAAQAGLRIKDGQSEIDTKGQMGGYDVLLKMGPCKAYQEAKLQFQLGDLSAGRAVMGPMVNENVPIAYDDRTFS